jgi:alkaline phosphatase
LWHPSVLANASHSAEYLAWKLFERVSADEGKNSQDLEEWVRASLIEKGLGIIDAEEEEIRRLLGNPTTASNVLTDMISRRAQIGWSTHGHSAVDVNIYGSKGSEILRGNHENTEVGDFLRNYLEVDVESVTKELNGQINALDAGMIPTPEELVMISNHYSTEPMKDMY